MKPILLILLSIGGLLAWPLQARADWVNFTGAENAPNTAEIQIENDAVRVHLEIFVDNLVTFDRLIPEEFFRDTGIKRPMLEERLLAFSREDLQIIADDGVHLKASMEKIEPRLRKDRPSPYAGKLNPFTGTRIPGPPEDKRVLYVELIYPFDKKPSALTIVPPLTDTGISEVPIGFITYHNRALVNDFRYLSEAARLSLDWEDPWYSQFENKALKRWQRGSVMSFLYVEPFEVRHEILARVKDLEAWVGLDLRGDEFIEADENDALKRRIGEYLLKQDKVLIDGQQLTPILDRTAFVKYAMTGSTFLVQPERLPINTAMVGVIITYLTKGLPQKVTNEWNLWSKRIQQVPADAIDPAGPFPSYLTPESNVLTWNNYLKKYKIPTVVEVDIDKALTTMHLPWASILCGLALVPVWLLGRKRRRQGHAIGMPIGIAILLVAAAVASYPFLRMAVAKPAALAPQIEESDAVVILESLLKNIYRSFDFREENDVYDRLATSAAGDLLTDIYLQNRISLVITQAGGARARVKEVKLLDVKVAALDNRSLGMRFDATWMAKGTVGHWGHIHTRKNWYHAGIAVEPLDGTWKITAMDVLEEKRIDPNAQNASALAPSGQTQKDPP